MQKKEKKKNSTIGQDIVLAQLYRLSVDFQNGMNNMDGVAVEGKTSVSVLCIHEKKHTNPTKIVIHKPV
jgi:hypothetical protein